MTPVVAQSLAESMRRPDIALIPPRNGPHEPRVARALLGLADLPTVVATGPFDELTHICDLAAAYTLAQRISHSQLVLLGTGAQLDAALRAVPSNAGTGVCVFDSSSEQLWSDVIAAADLVVLSPTSGSRMLLDVMSAGRAVIVPADPASVRLVVPLSAGLVYRPGDLYRMAAAMSRLLTSPRLRSEMAARAMGVAYRERLQLVKPPGQRERI